MGPTLLALALTTVAAQAEDLHCMGISPGFLMVTDGATTTFDYLGDGVFTFDPPLPDRIDDSGHATSLVTSRAQLPVYIEERSCRAIGTDLPIRIELGVPSSEGMIPFAGCCRRVPQ